MEAQLRRNRTTRRATWLVSALVAMPLMASCTPPTATQAPTMEPPTDVPAPTGAPSFAATGALTTAPDAFMNVGGGLRHFPVGDPMGLLAIEVNASEVAASAGLVITVTVPISCPGSVANPVLEVSDGDVKVTPSLDKVVEGLYQAVIRNDVGDGEALFSRLCQANGTAAHIMAYWECDGVGDELSVGQLTCGQVDLTGLEDPRGHVNASSNCADLTGIKTTLIRVNGGGMVPGGNGCETQLPADGWQWSTTAPVGASVPVVTAMPTTLSPQYNPLTSDVQGFFAWNAPPGGCYYVKATNSAGCPWFSQVFGVEEGVPVIGLNLLVISSVPNCAGITSPCSMTPTTIPTATPTP